MFLDHISYAVRSTDKSIDAFRPIYPIVDVYKCEDKRQNIFITFLSDRSEKHRIELIEPINDLSPVENILGSEDSMLYHLCYRVENFTMAEKHFLSQGFLTVTVPFHPADEPSATASHMYNESIGLIEIICSNEG